MFETLNFQSFFRCSRRQWAYLQGNLIDKQTLRHQQVNVLGGSKIANRFICWIRKIEDNDMIRGTIGSENVPVHVKLSPLEESKRVISLREIS